MSEENPKKENSKFFTFNRLIYGVCGFVILFVGINIVSCNLMIPGTLQYANSMGKVKTPSTSSCEKTQKDGINSLLTVIGLLIAYKANSKE